MSDTTPVIIGAVELTVRPEDEPDLGRRRGPIELMTDAARLAADDAGAPSALDGLGLIAVAGGIWTYPDPGRLVAEQLGIGRPRTLLAGLSGDSPQKMVGLAADRIARGELTSALVLGGEARWTMRRLKAEGRDRTWIEEGPDAAPADERLNETDEGQVWEFHNVGAPAVQYALLESALRARAGEDHEHHRRRIAALWAHFSEVAAAHPHAWDRTAHPADEIMTPSAANRMISWPYTKAMVANNQVDMATALLITTTEQADRLGVAEDRRVHLHAAAGAHDTMMISHRDRFDETPAVGTVGRAVLDAAGIGIDDVAHLDLYSCFPSIVQMSTAALGITDLDRSLTQTGGLGFGGAPMGNASGHGIVAMVTTLREHPGQWGLVHANGGTATKHAIGVYSTDRPTGPVRWLDVQDRTDLRPRALVEDHVGLVEVEAHTVEFDRHGPARLVAAGRTAEGARTWVTSEDPELMELSMTSELVGREGWRDADGRLTLD